MRTSRVCILFVTVAAGVVAGGSIAASRPIVLTPQPSPATFQCWSVFSQTCADCPTQQSRFCNPFNEGMFETCSGFLSDCQFGHCQQVTAQTGPGCP